MKICHSNSQVDFWNNHYNEMSVTCFLLNPICSNNLYHVFTFWLHILLWVKSVTLQCFHPLDDCKCNNICVTSMTYFTSLSINIWYKVYIQLGYFEFVFDIQSGYINWSTVLNCTPSPSSERAHNLRGDLE